MNDFTASNGRVVRVDDTGYVTVRYSTGVPAASFADETVQALREFFRHEEDERLKRERSATDPDMVVYRWGRDIVFVLDERTGQGKEFDRALIESTRRTEPVNDYVRVARAFFDAHPVPKPAWHDAKPGELWVIRLGQEDEQGVMVESFEGGSDVFQVPDGESISIPRPSITSGRRIWPEDAS